MEQIGEGGMGAVYMAEQQQPLRRRVALKVIKPAWIPSSVIARFEAERQALALMDHPNIARVLDAGTTESGPSLLRDGTGTRRAHHRLLRSNTSFRLRERLEFFVEVCHAVQHAHQKGIIHRDIKPSNVLVTLNDGQPVEDHRFWRRQGHRTATHRATLFTNFAEMVGTPLYMSPEQAEMSSLDVDTRTDIYSLGVLLYELLTGTTPLTGSRFRKASFDEIRRIIREEDPSRPARGSARWVKLARP